MDNSIPTDITVLLEYYQGYVLDIIILLIRGQMLKYQQL